MGQAKQRGTYEERRANPKGDSWMKPHYHSAARVLRYHHALEDKDENEILRVRARQKQRDQRTPKQRSRTLRIQPRKREQRSRR